MQFKASHSFGTERRLKEKSGIYKTLVTVKPGKNTTVLTHLAIEK